METQKLLKPAGKTVIVSDYREKEIIEHLKKLGATVNEQPLEVADHVCSERVAIERKTYDDFISSIIDGRIFEQARDLKENFEKPMLVIEGYSNREINENALKGAVASLLIDFGISLLNTRNSYDTAKTIFWIAQKEQKESKFGISIRVGKKPKDTKRLQEFILSSIPGVSTVLARRLLQEFGCIERIVTADERELRKVEGIGEKLAKSIRKILTEKY
jgi:Fanconi anemia group M protein